MKKLLIIFLTPLLLLAADSMSETEERRRIRNFIKSLPYYADKARLYNSDALRAIPKDYRDTVIPQFISPVQLAAAQLNIEPPFEDSKRWMLGYFWKANVIRIIDGDTIVVQGITYRLAHVNTPETTRGKHEPGGEEATTFVIPD